MLHVYVRKVPQPDPLWIWEAGLNRAVPASPDRDETGRPRRQVRWVTQCRLPRPTWPPAAGGMAEVAADAEAATAAPRARCLASPSRVVGAESQPYVWGGATAAPHCLFWRCLARPFVEADGNNAIARWLARQKIVGRFWKKEEEGIVGQNASSSSYSLRDPWHYDSPAAEPSESFVSLYT